MLGCYQWCLRPTAASLCCCLLPHPRQTRLRYSNRAQRQIQTLGREEALLFNPMALFFWPGPPGISMPTTRWSSARAPPPLPLWRAVCSWHLATECFHRNVLPDGYITVMKLWVITSSIHFTCNLPSLIKVLLMVAGKDLLVLELHGA